MVVCILLNIDAFIQIYEETSRMTEHQSQDTISSIGLNTQTSHPHTHKQVESLLVYRGGSFEISLWCNQLFNSLKPAL